MAILCAECGKRIRKAYISADGLEMCKTCCNAEALSLYVQRMEKRRLKDEPYNKLAYDQCSEIAAWLSVYRFGAEPYRKRAAAVIDACADRL